MSRNRLVLSIAAFSLFPTLLIAQSGTTWAIRAMAAVGPNALRNITASGNITVTIGDDVETGTVTLQSSGLMNSQITISTGAGTTSESHTWQNGSPAGTWTGTDGTQTPISDHNCWTDSVWFFPGLSLLADYADQNLTLLDLGQTQFMGMTVEHVQAYRTAATPLTADDFPLFSTLSTVDYYLDPNTALPLALAFNTHPDNELETNIPVAATFGNYQSVNGVQVPFQIVEYFNGSAYLQITLTSATPN